VHPCNHQGGDRRRQRRDLSGGSDRTFSRYSPPWRRRYRKSADESDPGQICGRRGGERATITQITLSEVPRSNFLEARPNSTANSRSAICPHKNSRCATRTAAARQGSAGNGRSQVKLPRDAIEWSASSAICRRPQAAVDRGADQPDVNRCSVVFNFGSDGRHHARHESGFRWRFRRVLGLLITGIPVSVSAAIGFVALFASP